MLTPRNFFRTPIYAHRKSDLTETTSIPSKNLSQNRRKVQQPSFVHSNNAYNNTTFLANVAPSSISKSGSSELQPCNFCYITNRLQNFLLADQNIRYMKRKFARLVWCAVTSVKRRTRRCPYF